MSNPPKSKLPVHRCTDCDTELVHSPRKGRWPTRCPQHAKENVLAIQRVKQRALAAKRKGKPRPCIEHECKDYSVPPLRLCPTHLLCVVDGCSKPKQNGRRCGTHKAAKFRARKRAIGAFCAVDGCERYLLSRDLCGMHYKRKHKYGEVGQVDRLWNPYSTSRITSHGYMMIKAGDKWQFEHRVVMEQSLGRKLLKGETVHHLNGKRDDNRSDNLELWVTPPKNGQRVTDLIVFICERYPDEVQNYMKYLT